MYLFITFLQNLLLFLKFSSVFSKSDELNKENLGKHLVSISLYLIVRCKTSVTLVREGKDPWYISGDYYLYWYEALGGSKSKVMKVYAQSGQYRTIMEIGEGFVVLNITK